MGSFDCPGELALENDKILGINTLAKITLKEVEISYALNLPCIFSVLVSRLFICNSNLFSRFWIIFTVIIWNSLSGRFPISSSFV